jgi:capsular exopolysaccharide synthesis family protein
MDNLEKVLTRAKEDRLAAMPKSPEAAERPKPVPMNGMASEPLAFSVSKPVDVDEAQLERHRILAHRVRSHDADIFRILRTQILQIMNKSGLRTLAITSPHYGDGKTTIALNLALSIALDLKQTVLLADLDLRKPNLHEYLGLDPEVGLSNYLLRGAALRDCLVRPAFDRLNTLPAGPAIEYSSEILGSPKMAALAQEMKSRYPDRMIIYDMPPVLAQDDSIAFMPHVDAVLLVVRDGVTHTDELKRCLDRLADANVIGTVLNDTRDTTRIVKPKRRRAV